MGETRLARAEAGKSTRNAVVDNNEIKVRGFLGAATCAGFRYKDRDDLAVIFSESPARAAGVFTQNRVKAAPVLWCQEIIARDAPIRAVVINSGIANACTGSRGYLDVVATTNYVSEVFGIKPFQVLVASTGIIGKYLNTSQLKNALPKLKETLSNDQWEAIARAIMTTDSVPKMETRTITIGKKDVRMLGIAKGAGMIAPNMATLLCFILTDLAIHQNILQEVLKRAADQSFNRITVDGDTSTNDSLIVLANGTARNKSIASLDSEPCRLLQEALNDLLLELAKKVVRDGEGATKDVEIRVIGAVNEAEARNIAFTIANSPLVKTAIHGEDANWGRIVAAAGKAQATIDPSGISVYFDDVCVVNEGVGREDEIEEAAKEILKKRHYVITMDLGLGTSHASVLTCDLSPEYVKINASYRT